MRNQSKLERARVSEAKCIDNLCVGAFDTRHEAQMQTERDRPCVAKKIDRLSDGVVVGTQIEPARTGYQVGRLGQQIGHLERQVGRLGCQVGCLGCQVGRLGRQVDHHEHQFGRFGAKLAIMGAKLAGFGAKWAITSLKLAVLGTTLGILAAQFAILGTKLAIVAFWLRFWLDLGGLRTFKNVFSLERGANRQRFVRNCKIIVFSKVFHGFSSPGAAPGALRASKIGVEQGCQRIAGRQSQSSRPFEQATRAMPGQIEPATASQGAAWSTQDARDSHHAHSAPFTCS